MSTKRLSDEWAESQELGRLLKELRENRRQVLVVTGAGISLASGIPTFRGDDPGAVWKRDVTELGTVRYFFEEPEGSWRWYLHRFEKVFGAAPNAAHEALVAIERHRAARRLPFLLVTQNIDGLHRHAGSTELVEVHGTAERVRCSSERCELGAPRGSIARNDVALERFLAAPTRENVPRCPACGAFLRQHILWFDELYTGHQDYQWERVCRAVVAAGVVLFVGTSMSVGVTELIHTEAWRRGTPIFSVDPAGSPMAGVTLLKERSELLLPWLAARMG